jgi:cellulose biosynthesis protein BcsQ
VLNGVTNQTPQALLSPLATTGWRISPFNADRFRAARASGGSITMVLSDAWLINNWTGHSVVRNPWDDWTTYANAIKFTVQWEQNEGQLPDYWDILLIDTPPTLGYLSLAHLVACDRVVIPVEPHALGLPGVASVIASIDRARQHVNPRLEILGIVATRVHASTHTREVVARLRSQFGAVVLEHTVREAIQIAEAPGARLPITRYAPTSSVAEDYRAVATEILDRLGDLSS